MNNIIKLSLTLAVVACISALTLSGINMMTAPRIEENTKKLHQEVLEDFFAEINDYTSVEVDGVICDMVFDKNGNFLGVLARAAVEGYGGPINYYLMMQEDGEIGGISILSHSETPGIGTIIAEPDFHEQFLGRHYEEAFNIGDDVDIVTGATISTEAMILSIGDVVAVVGKEVLNGKVTEVDGS